MRKSNSFIFNSAILIGSNAVSQGIAVLSSVIQARLYSPLEMGVYSTYISILAVLSVISCFQFERAIILIEDEKNTNEMISLCLKILVFMSLIVLMISNLFSAGIARITNVPELEKWIRLMPLSFFCSGCINVMTYWHIKQSNMKMIASVNLITVIILNLSQMLLGMQSMHLFGGMIVGHLLGNSFAAVVYLVSCRKNILFRTKSRFDLLRRYKNFPLFVVPSTFLDTLGANSPNILLSNFFGATITGLYSLGYRLLSVPITVITSSITQAFLPKAIDARRDKHLDEVTIRILTFVSQIGIVPLLLISIVSNELINIVFGSQWGKAATFVPWMCIWLLFGMLYAPISNNLTVLEKQKNALIINSISIVAKLLALICGGLVGDPLLSVALCSIVSSIVSVGGCVYIIKLVNGSLKKAAKECIKSIIWSVLFVIPTVLVKIFIDNYIIILGVGVVNGIIFICYRAKELRFVFKHNSDPMSQHIDD